MARRFDSGEASPIRMAPKSSHTSGVGSNTTVKPRATLTIGRPKLAHPSIC